MKKLKNIALMLSIGALTATLPYTSYSTQALPINDVNEKEIKAPLDIFNLENKNTKRNQKEEMAEVLVNLYNKYNDIFKKGIEINDIRNSNLYFNITKQKSEIKDLINEIINYPYSVVNSKIEQDFLKSNILFCYLTNQYIQNKNLNELLEFEDIEVIKDELINIFEIVNYSSQAIENSKGNYFSANLNDSINKLNNLINKISDFDSLKSNIGDFKKIINDIQLEINLTLSKYINT